MYMYVGKHSAALGTRAYTRTQARRGPRGTTIELRRVADADKVGTYGIRRGVLEARSPG